MASDQARDLARLANEQAFDLVGIDGGVRLYKLQQTIEKLAALATPPAAATSTPCASGEGLPEMKSYAQPCTDRPREDQYSFGRYVDGWNSCHKAFTRALAATQAPATREAGLWAELLEFLEDHEDVSDGPDGEQRPNRAMQLAQAMRDAATRTPTAGNTEDARSMGEEVFRDRGFVVLRDDDGRHDGEEMVAEEDEPHLTALVEGWSWVLVDRVYYRAASTGGAAS